MAGVVSWVTKVNWSSIAFGFSMFVVFAITAAIVILDTVEAGSAPALLGYAWGGAIAGALGSFLWWGVALD